MIDSTVTSHRLLGRSSKRIDGERKVTGASVAVNAWAAYPLHG